MRSILACFAILATLSCGNSGNALPKDEGCQEDSVEATATRVEYTESLDSIYMVLPQSAYGKDVDLVKLTFVNKTRSYHCVTGEGYFIEKEENGEWIKYPLDNGAFHDIGIGIGPESTRELPVRLSNVKKKYTPGHYRVGKHVRIQSNNGYRDTFRYCEYYIEDSA